MISFLVHFVPADDPAESAAVREVDLQRKFHGTATELAKKLNLTNPKATALRRHLGVDNDPDCVHEFHFGGLKVAHPESHGDRVMWFQWPAT